MTTIYQQKGAVHGFAFEWYRLSDCGAVEYLDLSGSWRLSKADRFDLAEWVAAGYFEPVPWRHFLDGFTDWRYRMAGPIIQQQVAGKWGVSAVRADEVDELFLRGVLSEYSV